MVCARKVLRCCMPQVVSTVLTFHVGRGRGRVFHRRESQAMKSVKKPSSERRKHALWFPLKRSPSHTLVHVGVISVYVLRVTSMTVCKFTSRSRIGYRIVSFEKSCLCFDIAIVGETVRYNNDGKDDFDTIHECCATQHTAGAA